MRWRTLKSRLGSVEDRASSSAWQAAGAIWQVLSAVGASANREAFSAIGVSASELSATDVSDSVAEDAAASGQQRRTINNTTTMVMTLFTKRSFLRVFTMMYHKKRCKDKTFLPNHSYVS